VNLAMRTKKPRRFRDPSLLGFVAETQIRVSRATMSRAVRRLRRVQE